MRIFSTLFRRTAHAPSTTEVGRFVAAAAEGHERAVRKFIKNYPDHIDAISNDSSQYGHSMTALTAAAQNGRDSTIEILLEAGAQANRMDSRGYTAFLAQADHWRNDRGIRILKALLKRGANINARDKYGLTSLMYAAQTAHEDLCDFLIKNNADPLLQDGDGMNARQIAINMPSLIATQGPDEDTRIETAKRIASKLNQAEQSWIGKPNMEQAKAPQMAPALAK